MGTRSLCVVTAVVLGTLLGASSGAAAQETRTIQGVIRDSVSRETLPFVAVVVSGTDIRTRSNRDGFFAVIGAPATTFTLRVTAIGYQATQVEVGPEISGSEMVSVELPPIPFVLDEITVVAEEQRLMKANEEVSKVTISPRDLAVLPTVGEVDIFRTLQLLPGISGTNESSAGLYVRGGTPDQNLVLLDGMTVYHVDHFFGFFSAFNADAIKDVQVYKSGFPAQYGGRVSSVVDMTGKTGDPNSPHLTLGANLLSAQASGQVPLFGKGSIVISARRSYTDIVRTGLYSNIFDLFNGQDSVITGAPFAAGGRGGRGRQFQNANLATVEPDFYFYDINAKITYHPSAHDVTSISFYNGQDYLDNSRLQSQTLTTQGNQVSRDLTNDITELTNWGNKGISGKWARQWHPRLYTNATVAYSEYFSDYRRTTGIEVRDRDADTLLTTRNFGSVEDNLVRDLTFRLDNEWQALQSHKVKFGGWTTRSAVDYAFTRNDSITILDQRQKAVRVAAYLQDHWTVLPSVQLTLGGRVSYYDQTGETYLEPRASASVALTRRLTVKAAYGQYHQFVSRVVNENVTEGSRDFWLLADGDLVDITSSKHYVVGASYETDTYLFDVELYRKDLAGLSEFSLRFQRARDPDPLNLFFDGTGVAEGIEFLAQRKFGALTGWASYTLARVDHTFPDLNDGEPFPALHDQTHEIKAVGNYSLGRLNLAATWAYATGKPYTAPESEYAITLLDGREQSYIHVGEKNALRLPAYHRLDVAAHYRFGIGRWIGDIGLSVFNLYDRTNIWYRQFELSESPALITDVTYLGMTPNISLRFEF